MGLMGSELAGTFCEKDLGIIMNGSIKMSAQRWAKKANRLLDELIKGEIMWKYYNGLHKP